MKKNGLLIWNVLLTLVTGYLLILHFSSPGKKNNNTQIADKGNKTADKPFLIAYFEMDSVAANFEMVKAVKAELNKKEDENNQVLDKLAKQFQQTYKYYQDRAKAGTLTQAQSDSANEEIKRLDNELKMRKQQLDQEYNDFMARRQNDIKIRIETFLKDYNKDKRFSYIISYEQGLFYYRDSSYNITNDVINGLNEAYKKAAKD